MFYQSRKLVVVVLVAVICLSVGLASMSAYAQVGLPSFSFPWPSDLNGRVTWTGGMHKYANLDDTALVPIGTGSGLDFSGVAGYENFQVLSMAPGTVEFIGTGAFGKQVAVRHQTGGSIVIYGHLDSFSSSIVQGGFVYRGQPLGYAGRSGATEHTHLHIELRDGSDLCCSLGHIGGGPVGWHGRSIDGWIFFEYRNNSELAATLAYNYDGVAIKDGPNVFWDEAYGQFYTDAGMSQAVYLYTWLPVGYQCVNPGPCDRLSTNPNLVGFSNHGVLGGGAMLTSSNNVLNPPPTLTPVVGPTDTPAPQYGDSHVDIRENTNYQSGQYGWDNPTNGWVNVVDYMNDRTSSIQIDAGWSIKVASDVGGGGATKCLVTSFSDLSGAYYDNGSPMTDTISSVWVYSDSTCGGSYLGTEPGDTVTVWVDPTYWGTHYGWHDPAAGNVPGYVGNGITSIGVTAGWSAVLYESGDLGGGFACFTASDPDLTNNTFNNGNPVNDTVDSIEVFHDSNCGGRMHAPTVNFTASVTNVATKEATYHLVWSGASPGWQHFDFGDGQTYDVQGGSGDVSPTHQYANFGTYNVVVTVYGTDGVGYPYTQQLVVAEPPTPVIQPPVLSLSVAQGSGADFNYIEVDADWSGAAEDWQLVNFGDGGEVGYFGSSGTSVGHPHGNVHWYTCCGAYTVTFSVRGLDGQIYTDTEVVNVQSPPEPVFSFVVNVVNPTTGLVEANATWSGASGDWHIVNWGDGTETGYQGSSGTSVGHPNGNAHYYPPGSYTLTFTVKDVFGQPHTLSQNIIINAPSAPAVSLAYTQGTGESFNYFEVQANWSGAAEDWHVVNWGDGSEVGYFGSSGTSVGHPNGNSHWYAVGNYTITFTVKGLDGQNHVVTQQVSVVAP